jgi:hypothetical protein
MISTIFSLLISQLISQFSSFAQPQGKCLLFFLSYYNCKTKPDQTPLEENLSFRIENK